MFAVSDHFKEVEASTAKINILQGGTSSGKTYLLCQLAVVRCMQHPGTVFTIVGQDIPNLKRGALRDMIHIINENEEVKRYVKFYNRSERVITFANNSLIEFNSYEDDQDAKSGKRQYLFINEANGVSYSIYWQLAIRTDCQIYLDYNPTSAFWVHDKLIGQENSNLFISDHRDNPFIPDQLHKEIESIKDPELFKVYARGKTGSLTGTIYPSWVMVTEWPANIDKVIWGADYGYTVDPTAIVKIGIIGNKEIIIRECCYKTGLTENQINEIMIANGYHVGEPFYSEHDPDMISALRRLGMIVQFANKSIRPGISKVKEFQVSYIGQNIREEVLRYKWSMATNVVTGEDIHTSVPDKTPDHLMDAIRYAIFTHFFGQ